MGHWRAHGASMAYSIHFVLQGTYQALRSILSAVASFDTTPGKARGKGWGKDQTSRSFRQTCCQMRGKRRRCLPHPAQGPEPDHASVRATSASSTNAATPQDGPRGVKRLPSGRACIPFRRCPHLFRQTCWPWQGCPLWSPPCARSLLPCGRTPEKRHTQLRLRHSKAPGTYLA